jgi:tRNA threonylcarbamoyladenosine biosynthesis protein TsaE
VKEIIVNSPKEMADLAREIAASAQVGNVFALRGTLGAGKSFFARNLINALQEKPTDILSPTFNLVYSYDTKKGEVFHFDLYRLKSEEELENIGFFEAVKNGICLIEWPEIAQKFLPKNYVEIEIKILGDEQREVRINGKI